MDVARSSFYAAFGDKHSLYVRALDRYEAAAVARIRSTIASSASVKAGITQFVGRIIEGIVAGPGQRGCFIGNCAAELVRGDRGGAIRVRHSLERIEATFRDALERARTTGELPPSADVAALARFIMAGIQGLRLVGKTHPDRVVLEDIARVMLRCLDHP
jgi:TetR/AcrR family transcriptional repressor of nem operon